MRAFYLTDFLVRQFDAFVWRPMGLDRHPELRDTIFAGYDTLVYLAQTDDPTSTTKPPALLKGWVWNINGVSPGTVTWR